MKDWRHLRGKNVVVHASGVTYRGVVAEVGLHALLLKAPTGFREIPWERIHRVEEVGATATGLGRGLPPSRPG